MIIANARDQGSFFSFESLPHTHFHPLAGLLLGYELLFSQSSVEFALVSASPPNTRPSLSPSVFDLLQLHVLLSPSSSKTRPAQSYSDLVSWRAKEVEESSKSYIPGVDMNEHAGKRYPLVQLSLGGLFDTLAQKGEASREGLSSDIGTSQSL